MRMMLVSGLFGKDGVSWMYFSYIAVVIYETPGFVSPMFVSPIYTPTLVVKKKITENTTTWNTASASLVCPRGKYPSFSWIPIWLFSPLVLPCRVEETQIPDAFASL